jgi:multidrug efflux pump subunit AcrA (membrane-fusion protein)
MVAKLPLSAVLSRGSGASVYVVSQAGELTLRQVTVTSFNKDEALVTGGISAGEKVVTLGVQKLEPGLKVRSVEAK